MLLASNGSVVDGIALNLLSNAFWAVIVIAGGRLLRSLDTSNPRRRRRVLVAILLVIGAILAVALVVLSQSRADSAWGWPLVGAGAVWTVVLTLWELHRFWVIGVVGADREIRNGLGYEASLRLVTTQLSFLGTGAHKLSTKPEFEQALRRCRDDESIRLLLRKPTDPALAVAARRAGKPEKEYQENVIVSLRSLARLQESIGNIAVRFYSGDLVFRIMLINRRIGLLSFNVYGHGDGSQLPQLHLVEAKEGRDVSGSFYYALERYFDERWKEAEPWDFQRYLP